MNTISMLLLGLMSIEKSNALQFNNKMCIDFSGWDWLTPFDGDYIYTQMINNKPSYKMEKCRNNDNCRVGSTLTYDNEWGRWKLQDADDGTSVSTCQDSNQPTSPKDCNGWFGRDPTANANMKECGELQTTAPTQQPTLSPTIPIPIDTTTEYNSIKSDEYNLINPYPECYYGKDQTHFCQEMYSANGNKQYISHPNYEERLTATLINMARLFPNEYRTNSIFGGNTFSYYTGQDPPNQYCGQAASVPLYYAQKGNEAARFHNYDQSNCIEPKSYSAEYNGWIHEHLTCNNPDRCSQFSTFTSDEPQCAAGTRWEAFLAMKPNDGAYISGGEGICGGNGCYTDGHCGAMFDPSNQWIGIGKWKGSNSYDILYGAWNENTNTPKKYPIVYGTHLDSRYYFGQQSLEQITSSNKIKFLLQWYGGNNNNIRANSVHLLFENNEHSMVRLFGDELSGFYEIDMIMNSNDNKHFCEPYAFIVEADDGNKYRLPENNRYFFGTAFFDSYGGSSLYECNENHYYKNDNNQWIANGGSLDLITSNEGCIGCSEAIKLSALN